MVIGYARVCRVEQDPTPQLDALWETGWERIYIDKVSGDSETRYQLKPALKALREGNVFVIWSLDRLATNLADLIRAGTQLR